MKPITVAHALRNAPQDIPAPSLSGKFGELSKKLKQGQSISDLTGSYGHGNARLDAHKPSPTLVKTAMFGAPKMIHPTENRGLSIGEAKRLASFPDAFRFEGKWEEAWARIGNSVPPKLMQAISEHIYAHLLPASTSLQVQEFSSMPLDFIDKPINPDTPRLFTIVSTFAGCGGSSLGYKWAGGKVVAAIEWDENAVATYRLNHLGTPILHRDITTVTVEEVLDLTGLYPGELDILDGSPPCQGFSTAGKRQIDDPRNSLFKEYVRLLRGLQPKVFVMENVSGMVKGHMKHVFAIIMRELKASGYQVKCQLMNAMYFGVPQSRERVIFVGVRNDLGIVPCLPEAQSKPIAKQSALTNVHNSALDIEESRYPVHTLSYALLAKMKQWEGGHEYHPRGAMFGLRRLAWDRPSRTILREDGGGASCQCCHPTENRRLTIPEIKRVGSFPDAFQLIGKTGEQWARIGNSVPPRFMQAIAEHIYTHILSKIPITEVSHA